MCRFFAVYNIKDPCCEGPGAASISSRPEKKVRVTIVKEPHLGHDGSLGGVKRMPSGGNKEHGKPRRRRRKDKGADVPTSTSFLSKSSRIPPGHTPYSFYGEGRTKRGQGSMFGEDFGSGDGQAVPPGHTGYSWWGGRQAPPLKMDPGGREARATDPSFR